MRQIMTSRHAARAGGARREGFALAVAVAAIVVVGAIIAGVFFASTQEFRTGYNTVAEARAFAAAEYGLNRPQSGWDNKQNLIMANGSTNAPIVYNLSSSRDSVTSKVWVSRLNDETFWVVSEGRYQPKGGTTTQLTAVKRTNAVLRLRTPSIRANGAITVAGDVTVQGAAQVTGNNTIPPSWTGCDPTKPNKAGIIASPTAAVSIQQATAVTGAPPVLRDTAAADTMNYVKYGDETWQSLVAQSKTFTGGAVMPSLDANGNCNVADPGNWGEPHRGAGSIAQCYNYFPIIYSPTSLELNANYYGQGILLVDGDLRINGTFEFYGIIIVKDDFNKGTGTAKVYGAVMAQNVKVQDGGSMFYGTTNYNYSECAVTRSLRGSASVVQAKERGWSQLY